MVSIWRSLWANGNWPLSARDHRPRTRRVGEPRHHSRNSGFSTGERSQVAPLQPRPGAAGHGCSCVDPRSLREQTCNRSAVGEEALSGERVERRLAAILAADVAGYSRLMGQDEEGTLAAVRAIRRELGDPKVKEHRGRIVKTTGDGLLIEFASVVNAVRCAVDVQQAMAERNAKVPQARQIEGFRRMRRQSSSMGCARPACRRAEYLSLAAYFWFRWAQDPNLTLSRIYGRNRWLLSRSRGCLSTGRPTVRGRDRSGPGPG
jgi:hypothetical protein